MNTARRIGKLVSVAFLCVVAAIGLGGFVYQSVAESSDLSQWSAPGRLFDVEGKPMHLYCQGTGSPTIVVEQGVGGYYDHWHEMNSELSRLTRVCAYDRAGMGYSAFLGRAVGSEEVAGRLRKLLSAADISDDLVLVGWSAGGIQVRNFYKQFPDKVAGMILVDSSHEQQESRMPGAGTSEGFDPRRILSYLGPFGVIRLSGQIERVIAFEPGSDEHKQRTKALYNQSHWARAYYAEVDAFSMDQSMNLSPPSLKDLPLTVITRGKAVPQGGLLQEREMVWQVMQQELAALSSQGQQIIAHESGHSIHLDQPELVLNAAMEMLAKIRSFQGGSANQGSFD